MVKNDDDDDDDDVTGVSFSEWVGLTLIHVGSGITCLYMYVYAYSTDTLCEQSLIQKREAQQ